MKRYNTHNFCIGCSFPICNLYKKKKYIHVIRCIPVQVDVLLSTTERQHVMAVSSVSHYKERKKEFTLKENGMND